VVSGGLAVPRRLGPSAKAALTVEIVAAYVRVRWALRRTDIRAVVAGLREGAVETTPGPDDLAVAARLGRAVTRVLAPIPARSRCLVQSLVLTRMLARRRIDSALVIGVAPGSSFAAHAWVETQSVRLLPAEGGVFSPLVRL
jgi:hypothetical protein